MTGAQTFRFILNGLLMFVAKQRYIETFCKFLRQVVESKIETRLAMTYSSQNNFQVHLTWPSGLSV